MLLGIPGLGPRHLGPRTGLGPLESPDYLGRSPPPNDTTHPPGLACLERRISK
jgi:hypothetical protein